MTDRAHPHYLVLMTNADAARTALAALTALGDEISPELGAIADDLIDLIAGYEAAERLVIDTPRARLVSENRD